MRRCPASICVLVDDREKKPIPFPPSLTHVEPGSFLLPRTVTHYNKEESPHPHLVEIAQRTVHFPSRGLEGDYCLKGFEKDCMIERKGSMNELGGNMLTKDFHRQDKAFRRLVSSTFRPIVYLDFPFTERYVTPDRRDRTEECLSQFFNVTAQYGIQIFGGHGFREKRTRYRAGTFVALLLLSYALCGEDPQCRFNPNSPDPSVTILSSRKIAPSPRSKIASSPRKMSPPGSTSRSPLSNGRRRSTGSPAFTLDDASGTP